MGRSARGNEHAETVVVGSGFGGSVAAYRLAEAGRPVVLLERGRPYPPGSFPRTPQDMRRNVWDPSEGTYGLFDIWQFKGFDSVVASGLGGGSLIYANALVRKDERWFVREEAMPGGGYERWPVGRADLEPHYDAVERMLGANPYPLRAPAYRNTAKTHAMITAAEKADLPWELPHLAVSFAANQASDPALGVPVTPPTYGNIHGLPRRTCRLTGECAIGCNEGAKNTLDHTYLSAAQHHGAEIRTRCEVRGIRPLDHGGYEVTYVRHDPDRYDHPHDTTSLPTHRITCDRLILGAGAYGTPYLLMRNASTLPGIGPCLGARFSRNGDVLGFLEPHSPQRAGSQRTGAQRTGGPRNQPFDPSYGPVTTASIGAAETDDGYGFAITDGGYPGFVDWLAEPKDLTGSAFRLGEAVVRWVLDRVTGAPESRLGDEIAQVVRDGTLAAGALPLIAVGRDVPDGVMRLRDGRLDIELPTETRAAYSAGVRETLKELAASLDADLVDKPGAFFGRMLTVHPVGGAPMGRDDTEGVCDSYGEVFHHPALYIADGSVMPGPVGTHPALTIAAHADRMASHILSTSRADAGTGGGTRAATVPVGTVAAGRNGSRNGTGAGTRAGTPAAAIAGTAAAAMAGTAAPATSLRFAEDMTGFLALDTSDPVSGERLGRELDQPLTVHLAISTGDAERFLSEPGEVASVEGWIACDLLGGRLTVQRGTFDLAHAGGSSVPGSSVGGSSDVRRMSYRLFFVDAAGRPLTLSGRKEVRDDSILDVWLDTSTLSYRLYEGHVGEADEAMASVRGAGVAHIRPSDFTRELTTFHTDGPRGTEVLAEFGRLYMGQLWDVYGKRSAAKRSAIH